MKKIICALTALIASVCLCLGLSMFFASPTEVKADGLVETFDDFETGTDNFSKGWSGWTISNGHYVGGNYYSTYYNKELTGDFVVEFDSVIGNGEVRYTLFPGVSGEGENINHAVPESGAFYVGITKERAVTVKSNNSWIAGSFTINESLDGKYHFTFIYVNNKLSVVVNNTQILSDLESKLETAQTKYFALCSSSVDDYVDNFRVKPFTTSSVLNNFIIADSTEYNVGHFDGGEEGIRSDTTWASAVAYNKKLSGNFTLSFKIALQPHIGTGGASRIALFSGLNGEKSVDILSGNGYYFYSITENGCEIDGNNTVSDIKRGTTAGDVKVYNFKMIYFCGKLYTTVNDVLIVNGQTMTNTEGYLAFRSMRTGDTISNITYSEFNIEDSDIEAAGQFGDKTTVNLLPEENNAVVKTTGAWTVAYYQEKLSGNFEISYDLFLGSNIEGANSQPVRIGLMVPTASGTLEGRAGSYYFYINATGIKLYSHDGNDTDRTAAFNNPGIIKKDGTANKYSILFRYVNNSLSIMVNNQLILNNYKNDAFTATEGYFGVQYQYTDEYMDNFKVTKFTEANSKKLTYDGEETLIGYNIQGETYSGLYNYDTIYGNDVNKIDVTPITVKSYAMEAGASVRINSVNGIRWYSTISKAERELVENYGAVFKTEISADGYTEKVTITHKDGFNLVGNTYQIYATITNIKSNHYNLKMTAQAYIEIKYADGTVGRIDATTAKTERCYSEVVLNALKDVSTSESGDYKYAVKNDSSITGKEGETVYSCYGENVYEYLRSEYNKTLSDKEGE